MSRPRYFRRIFTLFLAAAIAPAAAVSLLYTSLAGSALRNEAEARLDSHAANVAAIADSCARDLAALAQDPVVVAALAGPADAALTASAYRRMIARFPRWNGPAEASILSAAGDRAIITGTRPDDRDLSTYGSWGLFRELASNETAVSPRVATLSDGTHGSFSVGVQVRNDAGTRLGFAIADVRRSAIEAAAVSSGLPGGASIVFPSGKVVFNRSDATLEGSFLESTSLESVQGAVSRTTAYGAKQEFTVYAEAPAGFYDGFGRSARTIAFAGLVGAVGLAAVLALRASSSVTEPVLRMARSMRLVEAGDLSIRIEPSGDDELGDLARSFNTMTAEVAALLKNEVERQELLREAELRALAAQMNPHLLHNTLASIKSLAKLGRADEIALVVSRLGKILRAGAGRREGRSTIGDGLAFVRDYLSIEQVRFGDRFNFVIDVPRAMERIPLPPLSLEPLAENALTHGLERKRGHGTLSIRGRMEGSDAVMAFEDDGPGMERGALDRLIRSLNACETPTGVHGMGLLGTNRRLALEYGQGYGLSVLPADGASGFRVELRIPAGAAS
jgi:two-component system sensor histidine kinase YesM